MPNTTIDLTNEQFPNNRAELRKRIVELFLQENPGTGTRELMQKYRYNIKKFSLNRILYLDRPAYLNKGMDFLVRVENYNFRETGRGIKNAPRQKELVSDLERKKAQFPVLFKALKFEIDKIFNCAPYEVPQCHNNNVGIPVDILLESIRWLFVEQDVTYWHASGRNMLMDAINCI